MGIFPSGGFGFTIGPAIWIAAVLTLIPLLAAAFFSRRLVALVERLPLPARLLCPAALCVPYLLVASSRGWFRWDWFALYALLPVAGLLATAVLRSGLSGCGEPGHDRPAARDT